MKPGGRILILGECAEGVGSPEFAGKVASFSSYDSFLDEIGKADVEIDQWQLEKLALAGQKYELFFYMPGIANDSLEIWPPVLFASPKAAVAAVLEGLPPAPGWRWFRKVRTSMPGVPDEAQAVLRRSASIIMR